MQSIASETEDMTLPLEVKYKRLLRQVEKSEKELAEKNKRIAELEKRAFKLHCKATRYQDVKRLQKAGHQLMSIFDHCKNRLMAPSEGFNDEQKAFAEKALSRIDELTEELKDYMQP